MAFKVKIMPPAASEIDEAADYYSQFGNSARTNFDNAMLQAIERLELNPFFGVRYKSVRALPLYRLPYLVLFEIYESIDTVYILSLFNTYQNPDKYPQ